MENYWDSFWGQTLRWIAVLPAAILSGWIVREFFWLIKWVLPQGQVEENSIFRLYIFPFISEGFGRYAMVFIGVLIAPKLQRMVAITLALIIVIFWSFSFYLVYTMINTEFVYLSDFTIVPRWYLIPLLAANIIGAVAGVIWAWEEY